MPDLRAGRRSLLPALRGTGVVSSWPAPGHPGTQQCSAVTTADTADTGDATGDATAVNSSTSGGMPIAGADAYTYADAN